MSIVNYFRRPKRARKSKARPVAFVGPIIVIAAQRGRIPRAERKSEPEVTS